MPHGGFRPLPLGRRRSYSGRALDRDIDEMRRLLRLFKVDEVVREGVTLTVLNNGGADVLPLNIYGRDSAGKVAKAVAGASSVRPIWQALENAAPGSKFEALVIGPSEIPLLSGTIAAAGDLAWLSDTTAGQAETGFPSSGNRFVLGTWQSTTVIDGIAKIDLHIVPQSTAPL